MSTIEQLKSELAAWKQVAFDLATAVSESQMIAAYDAWSKLHTESEEQ